MVEFLQSCLTLPTVVPTALLGLVSGYWLLMIVSGIDLDVFDLDLDLDVDTEGHDSFLDWGMIGLKWFNLGQVPLMVWVSAFALSGWLMSVTFDREMTEPTLQMTVAALARDFGVALFAAKLLTQPLKGKLTLKEPNAASTMIGHTCVITTSEATPDFGQARYAVEEGAPLILDVQTTSGVIPQGHEVRIVDYSAEKQTFFVEQIEQHA